MNVYLNGLADKLKYGVFLTTMQKSYLRFMIYCANGLKNVNIILNKYSITPIH